MIFQGAALLDFNRQLKCMKTGTVTTLDRMNFWKELQDFCSSTTAHGFVNFTGKSKPRRLFWGIICSGKKNAYVILKYMIYFE